MRDARCVMDIEKNSLMLVVVHGVVAHIRSAMEDLRVDLCEDAGVGTEGGRDIFALGQKADCSFEQTLEEFRLDELA